MIVSSSVSASVREVLAVRVPRLRTAGDSIDHQPLGADGLGLDSIAIAEALLDCEKQFSVRLTDLLDGAPVTIARIAARVEQAPGP
jgi:acyl carrier protein